MKALPLILALSTVNSFAQYNTINLSVDASPASLERMTIDKLRIYPIRANDVFRAAHRGIGNYTLLQEAIEDKRITISEQEGGATVRSLLARNISKDTIYLMAGEVVKGGQQDRVIAQDVILRPGEELDLGAFCVESGRWSYREGGSSQFGTYFGVAGNSVREAAAKDKDQSKVWGKVGEITMENNAESGTSALTELEHSKEYQENLKAYIDHFKTAFDADTTVVGFVAVTGDSILGCDLFATNTLFRNAYEKILHAYITEAMSFGAQVTITYPAVKTYLDDFLADETRQEAVLGTSGFIFKHDGKKLHLTKF
jgi:hypothetical protein